MGSPLKFVDYFRNEVTLGDNQNLYFGDAPDISMKFVDGTGLTIVGLNTAENLILGSASYAMNLTVFGTLTFGASDEGMDVKFWGDTAGSYWEWDADNDTVNLVNGKLVIASTWIADTVGRPLGVELTLSVMGGNYVNAIKGYVDASSGGTIGLLSAVNCEIKMPTAACAGAFYPLEIEWVGQTSTAFGRPGTGSSSGFIYMAASGTVTDFDSDGMLMTINGLSSGGSNLFSTGTLRISISDTLYYLPLSTVAATFTTNYLIHSTLVTDASAVGTAAVVIEGGLGVAKKLHVGDDIVATTSTGADVNVNGIFELLTVSGNCTGSVCGLRVKAQCDGTARTIGNFYGANVDARLGANASDALSGIMAGLQVAVSTGLSTTGSLWVYGINIDLSEAGGARATAIKAFIDFQDYDYDGSFPCQHLFDVGGSASRCSTGTSGDIEYNTTLHILVNTADRYIPLSTVEGTYTTAFPIATTYASGIGFSSVFTADTSGYSGVRNVSSFSLTAAGVHKGIQSDVTYNVTGRATSIGVAGKVILGGSADFTGGAGYMWGVQGQMHFTDGCTINNEGSVWAGGRFVLTEDSGAGGWTHTDGHLCVVLIDSLLESSVTLSTGQKSLLRIGNWGQQSNFCTFDSTFHVYGRHTDHLFYFFDCDAADSFITAETSDPSGEQTHKIKVYLNNGSLTRYIMLYTDPS